MLKQVVFKEIQFQLPHGTIETQCQITARDENEVTIVVTGLQNLGGHTALLEREKYDITFLGKKLTISISGTEYRYRLTKKEK